MSINKRINSSKVYCKSACFFSLLNVFLVLIVAKCIVNLHDDILEITKEIVLIVAKCIVNGELITPTAVYIQY